MFDDECELTNEEILELMEKPNPHGLEPFGPDWEKEMDMHPLFMDDVPQEVIDGTFERTKWPVLASHLDMMYDDDEDLEYTATCYKDDGNVEYKKGTKEGFIKAIISYTEGLKKNCVNEELNSQLYCNRAAAQFSIGNYRRATQDCEKALEQNPTYVKAITRAAQAELKLGNRTAAIAWCDKALAIDKHSKVIIEMKVKALQKLKEDERNARKRAAQEAKEQRKNTILLEAFRLRNLNLFLPEEDDEETAEERDARLLDSLKCTSHGHVTLNEEGQLVWPVRLLYPEHATSDVIRQFSEVNSLSDHLSYMFPPGGDSPEWDPDREYTLPKLCAIYHAGNDRVEMDKETSLLELLTKHNIQIITGVPTFEIYVKGSDSYNKNVLSGS